LKEPWIVPVFLSVGASTGEGEVLCGLGGGEDDRQRRFVGSREIFNIDMDSNA
jgi:hypothetical protein